MSFLSAIPVIGDIIGGAKELISEAITDKDKKLELENKLQQLGIKAETSILEANHKERMAQVELNKEEAKSKSLFVAGWRPAVGWVCVFGLAYAWVVKHLLIFGLSVASIWCPKAAEVITLLPTLSIGEITGLLIPLLGLGLYRTAEKIKGVNNK